MATPLIRDLAGIRQAAAGDPIDVLANELRGANTGGGVVVGQAPVGAGTGSALRYLNLTTAQRNLLAPTVGMTIWNTTTSRLQVYDGTTWLDADLPEQTQEQIDMFLPPELGTGANATRVAQTVYEGASFLVPKRVSFNRAIVRITAITGVPAANLLLYQGTGGRIAAAIPLVATCAFAPAVGNMLLTPAEGTVVLEPGVCFALFGRSSGGGTSATFRTYTLPSPDLLTANVQASTHPLAFVTVIAATTTPATIAPFVDLTPTAVNVVPALRVRTV